MSLFYWKNIMTDFSAEIKQIQDKYNVLVKRIDDLEKENSILKNKLNKHVSYINSLTAFMRSTKNTLGNVTQNISNLMRRTN